MLTQYTVRLAVDSEIVYKPEVLPASVKSKYIATSGSYSQGLCTLLQPANN